MKSSDRVQVVDFLRGISILAVLALHAGDQGLSTGSVLLDRLWHKIMSNGIYGVSIFFVVSGFVITGMITARSRNLSQMSFRDFYVRRIARLWPLLFLMIAVGVGIMSFVSPGHAGLAECFRRPDGKYDLLFWISLPTFSINWLQLFRSGGFGYHWDFLWSLAVEEQFYFIYPLFLKIFQRRRALILALGAVILSGPVARALGYFYKPYSLGWGFMTSCAAFELIAWGCLLYILKPETNALFLQIKKAKPFFLWGGFLILAGVYGGTHVMASGIDRIWAPTVLSIAVCGIILGGEESSSFNKRIPSAINFIGRLSYGIYLFHALVMFLFWSLLTQIWKGTGFLIVAMVSVGMAWVSQRYFEEPVKRWIISSCVSRKTTPGVFLA